MKLSVKTKNELRAEVFNRLQSYIYSDEYYPTKGKLKYPKELLEELLFDDIKLTIGNKTYLVKLPVWSGSFLQCIDLSEVDFSDVSWCLLTNPSLPSFFTANFDLDAGQKDYLVNKLDGIQRSFKELNKGGIPLHQVIYSGTNAQIDLSQSFEAKCLNYIYLDSCDFRNFSFVDNSNGQIPSKPFSAIYVLRSDVSGSNLPISEIIPLYGYKSFFDGFDLSFKKINAKSYFEGVSSALALCSLRNTGIHIIIDKDLYSNLSPRRKEEMIDELRRVFNSDMWAGCFVNNKPVISSEEAQANKIRIRKQYESLRENMRNVFIDIK